MKDTEPKSMVEILREDVASPVARSLIQALNAELSALFPEPGATHFRLDAEEVTEGRGAFFVARSGGEPVGCGAIRRLDASTAEIKRMYVAPALRGRGVGWAILAALEQEARRLGVSELVLETGDRLTEALALYERCGFKRIAAFGEYVGSPLSVCMGKTF